jgi:hypothetical protein
MHDFYNADGPLMGGMASMIQVDTKAPFSLLVRTALAPEHQSRKRLLQKSSSAALPLANRHVDPLKVKRGVGSKVSTRAAMNLRQRHGGAARAAWRKKTLVSDTSRLLKDATPHRMRDTDASLLKREVNGVASLMSTLSL